MTLRVALIDGAGFVGPALARHNDGQPFISMIFTDDLVAFPGRCIRKPVLDVFNVAGASCARISDFMAMIADVLGCQPALHDGYFGGSSQL